MEEIFQKTVNFIRELYHQPEGVIPLHVPVFNGNEKKYLKECIDSTFVSSVGRFVDQFEVEIANYTGAKKAVACVNGTSALHLALQLVGVEPGHEVITQPLTFIATANAITYCGAQPIFLDVDIDTMGLSPVKLETWLEQNVIFKKPEYQTQNAPIGTLNVKPFNKSTGKLISACVPMHTFGHPCRIDEIVEICTHFHIPVIEDAAESIGSFYKKQHTGTFGKIGVLSFNGNKIITSGGGGMLLFQDEMLAKRAKHLTTQAKVPHPWEFDHDEIGYNYRMPNINAALGLAQLEQLPTFLKGKRQIQYEYKAFFSTVAPNLTFVEEPKGALSNYWLNGILLKDRKERDDFLKYTNENGVMTRPAWRLINELPMYRNCQKDDLRIASELTSRLINLPSSVRKY
jgi:perosamine synthetase